MFFGMRKDQFIEAADRYNKRGLVALLIPLSLAIGWVLAYLPFQHRFEAYVGTRFAGTISDILLVVPIALPVTVAFGLLISLSRQIDRKLGVACPHCGKTLASFRAIVIASKNCPHCGMKVLDDSI
jgi:DNA-directed RNA polymerase subunit RPC12/RpoP